MNDDRRFVVINGNLGNIIVFNRNELYVTTAKLNSLNGCPSHSFFPNSNSTIAHLKVKYLLLPMRA